MRTRRVVLVGDDDDTRVVASRLLQRIGCDVCGPASVEEALACLDELNPTHNVLDLRSPGAVGSDLANVVRRRQLPIRVAVLSAARGHSHASAAGEHSHAMVDAIRPAVGAVFNKPVVLLVVEESLQRA